MVFFVCGVPASDQEHWKGKKEKTKNLHYIRRDKKQDGR
jgi:hypothetical protein